MFVARITVTGVMFVYTVVDDSEIWCVVASQRYSGLQTFRCLYTKSNPIDDHSNISSERLQKQNFPFWATIPACSVVPPIYLQENILAHIIFSDLQDVYSGNRQIHTKC